MEKWGKVGRVPHGHVRIKCKAGKNKLMKLETFQLRGQAEMSEEYFVYATYIRVFNNLK